MGLDAKTQVEILRLHFAEKVSCRAIGRSMGIHHKTVSKVIKRQGVKMGRGKNAIQRRSLLDPYKAQIEKLLRDAPERSAVNILQRLRDSGYLGGIAILRRHLRQVRPRDTPHPAYLTLSFLPGEAGQVDWGEFGDLFGWGRKVSVLVVILCHSRLLYVEFALTQTLPSLLRRYERALAFFGGVPRQMWHDNMSTVVAKRCGRLVRFTEGFLAYAGFRHFQPVACNLGAGNEKGRVEDGVKLVRYQFMPGRKFIDINDMNAQAKDWQDRFANRREHSATRKVPELVWEQEKPQLLPLSEVPYDTDEVKTVVCTHQYRVHFDGNTYSVPWTLASMPLTIRGDDTQVSVYYGDKSVARHARCYGHGNDLLHPAHETGLLEKRPGADKPNDLASIEAIGPYTKRFVELTFAGGRSVTHQLKKTLAMATIYGFSAVEAHCEALLAQGTLGAAHLERSLRLAHDAAPNPPPMTLQKERLRQRVPRPQLESYDTLLFERHPETPINEKD